MLEQAVRQELPRQSTISAKLDAQPVTRLHILIAFVVAIAFSLDLVEVAMGNALSTIFSAKYNLSARELSAFLASVYIGAVFGAPLFGWAADHLGVRKTLTGVLLWLSLSSVLVATASSSFGLTGSRFLSGLALGAYPPLMIAYLSEITPTRQRGFIIFLVCTIAYLGPPIAILSVRTLTAVSASALGMEGWKWPFAVASLASLVASLLFMTFPESPRWLEAHCAHSAAERAFNQFAASKAVRLPVLSKPRTNGLQYHDVQPISNPIVLLTLLFFLNPWFTVAFPLLTGPILLMRGEPLSSALLFIGIGAAGPAIGTFVSGLFVDRFSREIVLQLCGFVMLLCFILFWIVSSRTLLFVFVTVFGICVAVYMPAMTTLAAELTEVRRRSTVTAFAWGANRAGAGLVPFIVLPLFRHGQTGLLISLITASVILAAIIVAAVSHMKAVGPIFEAPLP